MAQIRSASCYKSRDNCRMRTSRLFACPQE
jgi:hypothetical protein